MRENGRNARWIELLALLLLACLWGCGGGTERRSGPPGPGAEEGHGEPAEGTEHEAHGHEGHGHEGGEESVKIDRLSPEELEKRSCEHRISAYRCPECRYEVGVVRVPASLRAGPGEAGPGLVRTEAVALRPVREGWRGTGEVRLNDNTAVHISPRVPGVVREAKVELGQRVRQGDVLFRLDSVELGRALNEYERNRSLEKLSRTNYEREKSLVQRRISSEQEMIEARMVYEQHSAERKASEQALRVLGFTREDLASVRSGEGDLAAGILPVRAPRDGTVIQKHAVAGERVEPGSDVMLLADLSTLWAWVDVYEQDLSRLLQASEQGTIPAEVFVRAFPGRAFPGWVDYIGDTMEERTRTVKVRATVENTGGSLRPGMFCEVRLGLPAGHEVLSVPREAVLSDEGETFVFAHWKDDYFRRRPVREGQEFFGRVEILEGLRPGERIVREGATLLKSDLLREKMGAGCAD